MASVINTNMASISAQRFLGTAQTRLATSFERLSSGLRINRAQDDAAGMGISQALTSSVNSTSMAMRNANDAIGVIQTAEGALTEISTMLQRFKELATQGANGALSVTQLKFLSVEMGGLRNEVAAISARTNFNGVNLLANGDELTFQTGAETGDTITVETVDIMEDTTKFESLVALLGENDEAYIDSDGFGVKSTTSDFSDLADDIENAIDEVATQRAAYGSQVNRLGHNLANLSALFENLSSARSRVLDTDYANETAQLTKTQILQQAATAMLSQANAQPNVVLALLK
ncbi:MAG: flagellin FliC [Betaproteobacteria bacterium]|nr:flagellin FliC [Betaproteobacteria bacterium]